MMEISTCIYCFLYVSIKHLHVYVNWPVHALVSSEGSGNRLTEKRDIYIYLLFSVCLNKTPYLTGSRVS